MQGINSSDLPDLQVAESDLFAISWVGKLVDTVAITSNLVGSKVGTRVGGLEAIGISDGQIMNIITSREEDPLPWAVVYGLYGVI